MEYKEKKSKVWIYVIVLVLAVIVSSILGAGGLLYFFHNNPDYLRNTVTNITKTEKEVTVNENGIADAVEKVYDSVVVVECYKNNTLVSTGTGFFYKKDGNKYYLLTNHHVVDGGNNIKVVLTNGKSKAIKVEGSDVYADIAVLSFENDDETVDYPIVEIGSTESMKLGDTVFAIGAPIDSSLFSGTVTRGILSGKDRLIERRTNSNSSVADWMMRVIQTDTAINSGNSGGPLCNSNGQVIGINNMKLSYTGIESMGFSIPIEDALKYAEQLLKDGKIVRPYVGVSLNNANNSYLASYFNYSDDLVGVVLTKVVDNSPVDKAGIEVGDVITEVNGTAVKNVATFKYELYKYNPGDKISIKYVHDGEEKTTNLVLESNEN